MTRDEAKYRKFLARCEVLHVQVKFRAYYFAKGFKVSDYQIAGPDEGLLMKVRKFLCDNPCIMNRLAWEEYPGYDVMRWRGNILTEHEDEVWRAVIAPVNAFEEGVKDYWRNVHFAQYLQQVPDQTFYACWLFETAGKDREKFWCGNVEVMSSLMAPFRRTGTCEGQIGYNDGIVWTVKSAEPRGQGINTK